MTAVACASGLIGCSAHGTSAAVCCTHASNLAYAFDNVMWHLSGAYRHAFAQYLWLMENLLFTNHSIAQQASLIEVLPLCPGTH